MQELHALTLHPNPSAQQQKKVHAPYAQGGVRELRVRGPFHIPLKGDETGQTEDKTRQTADAGPDKTDRVMPYA